MVDDVQDIHEPHQQKEAEDAGGGHGDAAERVRAVRERREAEQRRRLDELRAHAAAAQAQRDQRDAERRRRAHEQRVREDDRRHLVEERKRAIWEAGVSRREALLRRDREREERVERQRAARSGGSRTNVFAFGSSTPRMLEPADTGGIFWGHRRASSTSNVMFTSAPLTRRSSTFDLDRAEREKKDESTEGQTPVMWSSVARRRTDLVPTIPAPRPPDLRSGETTPGSRPGSAMSASVTSVRRPASTPRRPRPASIAGTPRGVEVMSVDSTPSVSRDGTSTNISGGAAAAAPADGVIRRPHTARRPRPVSMHATPTTPVAAGDGKPPLHRKPKPPKENEKSPQKLGTKGAPAAASPSDSSKEPSVDKEVRRTPARDKKTPKPAADTQKPSDPAKDSIQVSASEVTQKLEALHIQNNGSHAQNHPLIQVTEASPKQPELVVQEQQKPGETQNAERPSEGQTPVVPQIVEAQKPVDAHKPVEAQKPADVQKPVEPQKPMEVQKPEPKPTEQKREEKPVASLDKFEETDMTASMIARSRITTEEEAKAALAERRRKAREEFERQAELERQRLAREAELEAERLRQEEERQRQLEEEARELAELQRATEEEKLRKAIEAQQQLEQEARERAAREEAERLVRQKEEEEEKKAREAAEVVRREEAEREEAERRARRQRVEAIMLRTRQKKAEEEKNQQASGKSANASVMSQSAPADNNTPQQNKQSEPDNGNGQAAQNNVDLLGLANDNANTQSHIIQSTVSLIDAERNSNMQNVDLLGVQQENKILDNSQAKVEGSLVDISNNVDLLNSDVDLLTPIAPLVNVDNSQSNVDLLSAQLTVETVKVQNGESKEENGYTIHNGHKENNGLESVLNNGSSQYPLTLHNAV